MGYKQFEVEFHAVEELFDLKKSIEIFQQFVNAVGTRQVGNNFNKYYDPNRRVVHPYIAVRMNLTDEQGAWREIQRIANQLINSNQIRWYSSQLTDWIEPPFVVKAHETGTKCAIVFKEQIDLNNRAYSNLRRDPDNFMWLFAVSLLRHSGFRPDIAWTYLRTSIPTEIDRMANTCSQFLINAIGSQRPHPDFVERFLHTFFNCTIGSEQRLIGNLTVSNTYRRLADSWQRTP